VTDNAIRQWRKRLQGCVDADGGQVEHSVTDILTTTINVIVVY